MNKIGEKLVCVGAFFILLAFGIMIYNNYEDSKAGKSSYEIRQIIEEKIVKASNETDVEKVINVDGYNYIGLITIPSLGIELPILDKWDYKRLKVAPCIYYGSLEENNLVICGHSYKSHFRYIYNLKEKDNIVITLLDGTKIVYEVNEVYYIDPYSSEDVVESGYDLTLFTCHNSGTERTVVHATRLN